MKRNLFILFSLMISLSSYAQGFLKVRGKEIINESGEPVILRGMGLGGWMLQEGYMFQLGNIGQQYRIREKISEVVGKEKTAQFYNDWLKHHTTKADIDSMAAWGFNSIRLPMHYNLYTLAVEDEPVKGQQTWIEKGFAITDSLLEWCKQNKIYLILDLHAAPGGQGNDLAISDRNPDKPSLWQSEENQKKTIALWKKLAARYAGEPWIGAYDIINEPNWGFEDEKDFRGTAEKKNEPLKQLMVEITKAIREVDKEHIIIIEGNGFGNNYNGILPTWDNNMVLSFHKYGNFNTVGAIQSFLDLREKYNAPIWLGESGENSNTWFTEAIQLVEDHGAGWAWWQEKKMGINNPLEIKRPAGYEKLLNYWSGKGEKPSEEEAWKILQELIENLKIRNNIVHRDVIDAMFRQVGSYESKPYKFHRLKKELTVQAADFDMGRQRIAYYDLDTASYHYTPGVNTRGNRGRMYRNDGVDISADKDGYFVYTIEDGEWMQYTVDVKKGGQYYITLIAAADSSDGSARVIIGDQRSELIQIPYSAEQSWANTIPVSISLIRGENKIRLQAVKGGFAVRSFRLKDK